MRDILMVATVPNTTAGTLREGKRYHVSDDLADHLVSGGYARGAYEPEAATREAPENAARRTGRARGRKPRSAPKVAETKDAAEVVSVEADDAEVGDV